ncbi:MAG: transcription elongation factor GreA, partial [Clostridiales bacterium]|nr:transcription elongation factor GreA [Clostridiales bacterium]
MTDKRNLERELEELRLAKLQVAEEIKLARGHGDLSENAEYAEAKNAEA